MPYLFTSEIFQNQQIQQQVFSKTLVGEKDILVDEVIKNEDNLEGILYELTEEEISKADQYLVKTHKRIEATFQSGKKGFIFIENHNSIVNELQKNSSPVCYANSKEVRDDYR